MYTICINTNLIYLKKNHYIKIYVSYNIVPLVYLIRIAIIVKIIFYKRDVKYESIKKLIFTLNKVITLH